jgi:serine/threonine protein phosphatase PrpC
MIEVLSHSESGGEHSGNEDALEIRLHPIQRDCYLLSVADGQGGQRGGGPAAKLACKTCLDSAASTDPWKLLTPSKWIDILLVVDNAVAADPASGFTTLVGCCIHQNWLCGASCGDSGLAFWCEGKDATILTQHQAKNPPIGSGGANIVPFSAHLQAPWIVAAMTDGVWKYVGWDRLDDAFKSEQTETAIERLLTMVRSPRNKRLLDDFTIVILHGE